MLKAEHHSRMEQYSTNFLNIMFGTNGRCDLEAYPEFIALQNVNSKREDNGIHIRKIAVKPDFVPKVINDSLSLNMVINQCGSLSLSRP
jgi:hypothetical protein